MSLPASPTATLGPGATLDNRYRIERLIGFGGMGEVYAATRLALSDQVAIKRLKAETASATHRSRFLVEARAAAHVRHPNVIQVFDFGQSDDLPYMVMELLEGCDLAVYLKRTGPVAVERALALFAPICAAVEAGHRRGVVHRDLKPSNVFLARSDDGSETVKVLDFGLAWIAAEGTNDLTAAGMLIGTPRYMAPEQLSGQQARPASDVWALGVILYRMLTGQQPFNGPDLISIVSQVIKGQMRDPREHVADLPDAVVAAIRAALTLEPEGRPRSPEQLARMAEVSMLRPSAMAPTDTDLAAQPEEVTRILADSSWSRLEIPATPSFGQFVGREHEIAQITAELEQALAGPARMVIVQGEAGIGKTRVVERFLEMVATGNRAVALHGRFHDYAGSRPPAFESFLAMLDGASLPTADADGAWRRALDGSTGVEAEGERWRVFQVVTDAFAARAGSRPLVLAFDDLQWATRADLDLIEHLHQALGRRGTLVVATARHDDGPEAPADLGRWLALQGTRRVTAVIRLTPFTEDLVRSWLDGCFGALRVHPSDLRRLLRATAANPYALAELVRSLVNNGSIQRHDDGWVCNDLSAVVLPETVQSLLRARLDGLEPAVREMLEVASVIGVELRFETLRRATGLDEDSLDQLVERAVDLRLLREDGVGRGNDYRFANESLRRVLYESMRRRRRLTVHRAVVDSLHELYGGSLERIAPVLAYHYDAIGDHEPALRWGVDAGKSALSRYDNDAAAVDLEVARRAADGLRDDGRPIDPALLGRLLLLEGTLARRLGRLDAAIAALRSASAVAEVAVDAALELSRCELDRGDLDAARRSAAKAVAASDDGLKRAAGRLAEATALLRMGRATDAATQLDELLSTLDDNAPAAIRSLAYRERAWAAIKLGRYTEADPHARRALDLARIGGDLLAEHHAVSALAALSGEGGDQRSALPLHARALELSRRLSLRRSEAIDLANIGETSFGLDDYATSLDHLHRGLAIFIEIGDRACEGDCRVNIGRVMRIAGQHDAAIAMLQRGRAICEATGRVEYATIAHIEEGTAYLEQGEPAAAETAFKAAVAACETHSFPFRWRAVAGRARARLAMGDRDGARDQAKSALSQVEQARSALASSADWSTFDQSVEPIRTLLAELEE